MALDLSTEVLNTSRLALFPFKNVDGKHAIFERVDLIGLYNVLRRIIVFH